MSIQFPKLHIATSVMNRIQNSIEDMEDGQTDSAPQIQIPPITPGANTPALGQMIEEGADIAPAPMEAPEDPDQAAAAAEGLAGGSPFQGLLGGALG